MKDDASVKATTAAPPEATGQEVPYQASGRRSLWGYGFFLGVLLLLTAWIWMAVEKQSGVVVMAWIVAGLWFTAAPLLLYVVDQFEALTSRRALASGFVVLTIGIGAAVLVGVSYIADQHADQLIQPIDTTESGRYTLGDATRKLLSDLEGTVYATYLARADVGSETVQLGLREEVAAQLRTFGAASPNLVYRQLDPARDPPEANAYLASVGVTRVATTEDQDVIVFSFAKKGQEAQLDKTKELKIDPYAFRRTSSLGETKWLGEKLISESIYELVYRTYRVYVTGGHGEVQVAETMRGLREALASQNVQIEPVPLELRSGSGVPADCDVLVVLDPKTAFQADEQERVARYLDGGGALFLTTDVADTRRELGLENVLDSFGMYARLNYLVLAPAITATGQRVQVFDHEPQLNILGPNYADHPIVRPLRDRGFTTVFVHSSYIELEEHPAEGVETSPLVWAPSIPGHPQGLPIGMLQQKGRTDYSSPIEGKDKTGSRLVVAAAATRAVTTKPGEPERDARIVYFADTDLLTDRVAAQVPTNVDLGVAAMQWLIRREGLIAVSERTVERSIVQLDGHDVLVARFWPLGVAILSLIAGAFVWWMRRR